MADVRVLFVGDAREKTNGKAERFIQTLLRQWAYKRPDSASVQRTDRLSPYLDTIEGDLMPLSIIEPRSNASVNNLLRIDS